MSMPEHRMAHRLKWCYGDEERASKKGTQRMFTTGPFWVRRVIPACMFTSRRLGRWRVHSSKDQFGPFDDQDIPAMSEAAQRRVYEERRGEERGGRRGGNKDR